MRANSTPFLTGFTLIELIIVIVILGFLGTYVAIKSISTAAMTLPSQAQKLASDIRHAQMLATSWGKSLRLSINPGVNGSYSVSCITLGVSPCNNSPVLDPAGGTFQYNLQKDVILIGTNSLDINSLGQPSANASYTLTSDTYSKTVTVEAITGFITVSP